MFLKNYNQGGIHINPANRGKFTASAKRAGMGVQEYAQHVMANSTNPILRKRANFAINAAKWNHQFGGTIRRYQDGGMTDAEAKVFYKNPRYVKSLADAERNRPFIGPPNYPAELQGERRPFIGPDYYPDLDHAEPGTLPVATTPRPEYIPANSSTPKVTPQQKKMSFSTAFNSARLRGDKVFEYNGKMYTTDQRTTSGKLAATKANNNAEMAAIADQRMLAYTNRIIPGYNISPSDAARRSFQGDRTSNPTPLKGRGVKSTPLGAEDFLAMSTFLPMSEGLSAGIKFAGKRILPYLPKSTNYIPQVLSPVKQFLMKEGVKNAPKVDNFISRTSGLGKLTQATNTALSQTIKRPSFRGLPQSLDNWIKQGNFLSKDPIVRNIQARELTEWASRVAKNPTQFKKLQKMINQTKNLGLE